MDEDLIAGLAFIFLFLCFPLIFILSITACIAGSRTRAWKKEQAVRLQKLSSPENEALVLEEEQEDDLEDDFLDTEDEEDYKTKKAEEEADRHLTPRQKFRKEFKKVWGGKGAKNELREREREERRKVAKAVAREIERLERRRARRNGGGGAGAGSSSEAAAAGDLLPRYEETDTAAVAGDRKQMN